MNNTGGGAILLISNSDQVGDRDLANQLIDDIKRIINSNIIIHAADFGTKNVRQYRIGDRNYTGNEYFYYNMTKITGGNYYRVSSFSNSFVNMLSSALLTLNGTINGFDLYTTFSDGFCYAKYFLNNATNTISYDKPIIEIGKFVGDFPFEITASGFYKSKAFTRKIIINKDDFVHPVYKNHIMWTGNYIFSLEKFQQQTNEVVSEIIRQSIKNRILSQYTAFLSLEEGDTLRPGEQPNDDEDDTPLNVNDKINNIVNIEMSANPNPFSLSTNIIIKIPENMRSSDLDIKICDLMGRQVKSYAADSFSKGGEISLSWLGDDDSGQKLQEGTYLLIVTTPAGRYLLKIVLMR
jgi:Ca-activated chloride channel family protein